MAARSIFLIREIRGANIICVMLDTGLIVHFYVPWKLIPFWLYFPRYFFVHVSQNWASLVRG